MHGQVLKKRFKETAPGKVVPVSRLFKLDWDGISNTIRAGTPRERGAYSSPRPVHPSAPRCISVREGARLQGFPDHFLFHPTKWHGFRQIGNSVSPLLAKKIGENLHFHVFHVFYIFCGQPQWHGFANRITKGLAKGHTLPGHALTPGLFFWQPLVFPHVCLWMRDMVVFYSHHHPPS